MYSYMLTLTLRLGDMLAKLITTNDMMWSLPCPRGAKILYIKQENN